MRKKLDKVALAAIIEEENKHEDGPVMGIASELCVPITRVELGLPGLDYMLGGGLPEGRITQLYGPESSGKSSLACFVLAKYIDKFGSAMFVDAEGTFDEEWAKTFGVNPNKLVKHNPLSAERALDAVIKAARAGMPLIVIDSIPTLVPESRIEADDAKKEGRRASIASLLSRELPVLHNTIKLSGTTVLIINQIRDRMNAMMYGDPISLPGGHMLKHMSSIIWKVARIEWETVSGETLGIKIRAQTTKNKTCQPKREAEFVLLYGKGFYDESVIDVKPILRELRKASLVHVKAERANRIQLGQEVAASLEEQVS